MFLGTMDSLRALLCDSGAVSSASTTTNEKAKTLKPRSNREMMRCGAGGAAADTTIPTDVKRAYDNM